MERTEREKSRENFEGILFTFKGNHKNLDFLKLNMQDLEEMKEYLKSFLKKWKKYYPDQVKTYVEAIVYTKKVSKLEAVKKLEIEIADQVNYLINTFQSFLDPFKIYTFWEISKIHAFLENHEGDFYILSRGEFPEFWAWDKDSSGAPPDNENNAAEYIITGLAFKKDINWGLTLLKNCELAYGLEEKEVILFSDKKIQIIQFEEYVPNFCKKYSDFPVSLYFSLMIILFISIKHSPSLIPL